MLVEPVGVLHLDGKKEKFPCQRLEPGHVVGVEWVQVGCCLKGCDVASAGAVETKDEVSGFGVDRGQFFFYGAQFAVKDCDLVFVGQHLGVQGLIFHDEAADLCCEK